MKGRFVALFLVGVSLAAGSSAQTKISGTLQCSEADPASAIEVGDRPHHLMALGKTACTWVRKMEIAGVQTRDGYSIASSEINGDQSVGAGFHVSVMANGDEFFVRF